MNKTVKTFEGELELGHLDMLVAASARDMWVEELQELAETDERIVFVTADGGYAGKENEFRLKHPDRMLPVGIAEMDQVGIASGLALCGKIPYINGFGPFLALRTLDQVHTNVCYPNLPVRIVNTHSGLTSASGPTHYNIMDIAIMRTLPNMTYVIPADANQCVKLISKSVDYPGPMCIRIARGAEPLVYTEDYDYEIGKAIIAHKGNDVTVVACGCTVAFAVSAANALEKEGIGVRVLDMHTVRPLDKQAIRDAIKDTGKIITAEDAFVINGLGSAVSDLMADEGLQAKFKRLGIPNDEFPPLGDSYELYAHLGYDPEGIKKAIREILE